MDQFLWFLFYLMFAIILFYRVQWVREARILIIQKLYCQMRKDERLGREPKYRMDDFEKNTIDFNSMVVRLWEWQIEKMCKKEFWDHIKNAIIK